MTLRVAFTIMSQLVPGSERRFKCIRIKDLTKQTLEMRTFLYNAGNADELYGDFMFVGDPHFFTGGHTLQGCHCLCAVIA